MPQNNNNDITDRDNDSDDNESEHRHTGLPYSLDWVETINIYNRLKKYTQMYFSHSFYSPPDTKEHDEDE